MQHFFVEPKNVTDDRVRIDDPRVMRQIKKVLRAKLGWRCVFLDNTGREFVAELNDFSTEEARFKILERRKNSAEPAISITLYQALPKKLELFEWILQKGTEIGVVKFVPLITERTERRHISNRERLIRILREAAEQSERGKIPELTEPVLFRNALSQATHGLRILLEGRRDCPPLTHILKNHGKEIAWEIFVGPEGGFTATETEVCTKKGAILCSLGKSILRTETAAIVSSAIIILHAE